MKGISPEVLNNRIKRNGACSPGGVDITAASMRLWGLDDLSLVSVKSSHQCFLLGFLFLAWGRDTAPGGCEACCQSLFFFLPPGEVLWSRR